MEERGWGLLNECPSRWPQVSLPDSVPSFQGTLGAQQLPVPKGLFCPLTPISGSRALQETVLQAGTLLPCITQRPCLLPQGRKTPDTQDPCSCFSLETWRVQLRSTSRAQHHDCLPAVTMSASSPAQQDP